MASEREGSSLCRYTQFPIADVGVREAVAHTLSDRHLTSFSFWPLAQPFSGLLQHEKGRRSDRGASRPQSAEMFPRLAFEMGDFACV